MAKRKIFDGALSASDEWLRIGQREGSFDCARCSNTFETPERLRQHQVDCISDEVDYLE